jgi:HlyD family secretion protein
MNIKSVIRTALVAVVPALLASCSTNKNPYDASGVFEATEVIVSSEAAGKLLWLDVDEGKELAQNEVVGYVDSVQLYLKKMQLLATMKTVRSRRPDVRVQIAAIEQQLATATSEKRRVENLLRANAANQKQLDDADAQIAILERQLAAQKITLTSAGEGVAGDQSALEIQVAQVDDQLKKCAVINPINGVVLAKYAQAFEITAPGKALYKIADLKAMILRAYIVGSQITQVKLGEQVTVFPDFGEKGSREYSGVISWISDKAEFTPKTIQTRDERANLVYAVKISVKNDGYLKIGMYAGVKLVNLAGPETK